MFSNGSTSGSVAHQEFLTWRDQNRTLEAVAAYRDWEYNLTGIEIPEQLGSFLPGEWVLPPLTFKLADNSAHGSITEGALLNYSGVMMKADEVRNRRSVPG